MPLISIWSDANISKLSKFNSSVMSLTINEIVANRLNLYGKEFYSDYRTTHRIACQLIRDDICNRNKIYCFDCFMPRQYRIITFKFCSCYFFSPTNRYKLRRAVMLNWITQLMSHYMNRVPFCVCVFVSWNLLCSLFYSVPFLW